MAPPMPSTSSVAPIRSGATWWTLRSKNPRVRRRPVNDLAIGPHLLRPRNTFTTFVVFRPIGHNRPFSATGLHDFDGELSRRASGGVRAGAGAVAKAIWTPR